MDGMGNLLTSFGRTRAAWITKLSLVLSSKKLTFYSITFGTASYLWFVGSYALNPRNTNWIYNGINADPITHYLGWLFFKQDSWGIPLGKNSSYGLEISSSVVYSDSIPLMAILGKLASIATTLDFQYFGIWLLICFILQTLFSVKVIQLFTDNSMILCLASSLFTLIPMFLWRIQVHIALSSHFLIIWAIYLILDSLKSRKDKSIEWLVLLVISSLVHPYLFAINLILWFGAYCSFFSLRINSLKKNLINLLLTLISVAVSCFLIAGYDFNVTNSRNGTPVEFGTYRWNLLAPLVSYGYSLFFSDLISVSGNFESYTYLGVGFWILIIIALRKFRPLRVLHTSTFRNFKWVLTSLICLTILAITNKMAIGNFRLELPLSENLMEPLSIFYASARFIWPTIYLFLFLVLILIIRNFREATTITLLSVVLIVQVVDTYPLSEKLRDFSTYSYSPTNEYLNDKNLVEKVSGKYEKLVVLLDGQIGSYDFPALTFFAYKMGMGTNNVSLARIDEAKLRNSRNKNLGEINSGNFNLDTVYVLLGDHFDFYTDYAKLDVYRSSKVTFLFPLDSN